MTQTQKPTDTKKSEEGLSDVFEELIHAVEAGELDLSNNSREDFLAALEDCDVSDDELHAALERLEAL